MNIFVTDQAVFALGYAGLILRRLGAETWQRLPGPWLEKASEFVNLVAGVEGPQGELWAEAADGSVISIAGEVVRTVAQVPCEPLGITQFQRQWFVSTLAGYYELPGDGDSVLAILKAIRVGLWQYDIIVRLLPFASAFGTFKSSHCS